MSQDPADQIPVLMPMTRAARDVLVERLRQARGGRPTEANSGADDKALARLILVHAAAMLIGEIERLDAGAEK